MDEKQVDEILAECERALASGGRVDLRALGFWKAVSAVKRRPDWVERYADRVASIDRQAFERSVRLRVPVSVGIAVLASITLAGLAFVVASLFVTSTRKAMLLLAGAGAILVATHDLAHLVVGRALGIRFTSVFLGGKGVVEPGLKIDYASYLRTPARQRAWMHASGAIVSKLVPFALLGVALKTRAPTWANLILLGMGIGAAAVDVLFSTRYSDWKRFSREMRIARGLEASQQR